MQSSEYVFRSQVSGKGLSVVSILYLTRFIFSTNFNMILVL